MTPPTDEDLREAKEWLYRVDRLDALGPRTHAALTTILTAISSAQADSRRLDWILTHITQYGTNGLGKLSWSVYDEDGKSLMHRASVSEEEVGEIKFDRAAIDRAADQPKEETKD